MDGDAHVVNYVDYHMLRGKCSPAHPGGILKRLYMEPLSLTITRLADILSVSRKTVSKIKNEKGAITPDMALRLSRALNMTPELWMNLQQTYDLWRARRESKAWKKVPSIAA